MRSASTLAVALLFPDLLGTYGDSGNAVILARRLEWRGLAAEVVTVRSGDPVPESCQIYVVGGGEDQPQAAAARQLGAGGDSSPLRRAVESGAAVLAVCAGLQILGRRFAAPGGTSAPGVGLFDCVTEVGREARAVGEIVVEPEADLALPALSGYENHAGITTLGPGSRPVGSVVSGVGNLPGAAVDGARSGRCIGTYLHGPVLARNPALADMILGWVAGPLAPLDDTDAERLRSERLAAAGAGRDRARWRLRPGRTAPHAARSGRTARR